MMKGQSRDSIDKDDTVLFYLGIRYGETTSLLHLVLKVWVRAVFQMK
jgi:hypothetical protein